MKKHASIILPGLMFIPLACMARGQNTTPSPQALGALNPDAIVDYRESLEPDGRTLIYRSVKVDSLDEAGKQIVIGQVLERTQDGNFRLVPGRQPEEADLYRQKLCQKLGGIDISNDNGGLIIGPGTLNGAGCKGPSPNSKASKYLPRAGSIEGGVLKESETEKSGEPSNPFAPVTSDYVNPAAPNTSTITNQNFTVYGRAFYGSTKAGMATGRLTVMNRCVAFQTDAVVPGQTGVLEMAVNCWSGSVAGFYPTVVNGCIPAFCRNDYGQVAVFQ
ncbi:hypothetical protein [Dyella flagellata]|uniref:Uncharacterized protein n=1 Tax=Dyella flagellata TaxID=1867833 RepID=A0ABQ5X606_9GAMM|nr:hypothetical protein [Dyella flagellata]GLQ87037.1 hypothetical protein GCM10007898_06030 [Dyella flagellata]